MSKQWTPELQSILLQGVFEECNISFSKALCEKIAARVRAANIEGFTECTPKAVENQLYKWKKKNAATTSGASASPATNTTSHPASPSLSKKTAPKTPKTPKTPRAKKSTGKKAVTPEAGEGEGEEEMVEQESPSLTKGRKRGVPKGEGREEGGGVMKKIKNEPATPESDYFSAGQVEREEEV